MSDILARIGVHRPVDVAVFVAAAAALAVVLLLLPGCGGAGSIQSAQLSAPPPCLPGGTPNTEHVYATRQYVTYCGEGETCLALVTTQIESGEAETWDPPLPTPMFPREVPTYMPPPPCAR